MAKPNELIYGDKAYIGVKTRAKGNGSMKRGKLTIKQKLRNIRIQKKKQKESIPSGQWIGASKQEEPNLQRYKESIFNRDLYAWHTISINYNFLSMDDVARAILKK